MIPKSNSVTCVTDVKDVTSVTMSDLNIRNVPEKLRMALRLAALQSGTTLRDFAIKTLADALEVDLPCLDGEDEAKVQKTPEAPKNENKAKTRSVVGVAAENCPRCEKRMSDWVTNWHCETHGNFAK